MRSDSRSTARCSRLPATPAGSRCCARSRAAPTSSSRSASNTISRCPSISTTRRSTPITQSSGQSACSSPIWGRPCWRTPGRSMPRAICIAHDGMIARSMTTTAAQPSLSACSPPSAPAAVASRRRKASPCRMSRARCCGRAAPRGSPCAARRPGTKVHASGTPFTDRSGDRLRDWMGVTPEEFYDESGVAIVPMGFCFPGQDAKGADLPPRRECAELWHRRSVRGAAAARARARGRLLRAKFPSGRGGRDDIAGDDAGLADASEAQGASARAAAAAPLLAQQRMAQGQSLVRSKSFCRRSAARCGGCSNISACEREQNNLLS